MRPKEQSLSRVSRMPRSQSCPECTRLSHPETLSPEGVQTRLDQLWSSWPQRDPTGGLLPGCDHPPTRPPSPSPASVFLLESQACASLDLPLMLCPPSCGPEGPRRRAQQLWRSWSVTSTGLETVSSTVTPVKLKTGSTVGPAQLRLGGDGPSPRYSFQNSSLI